MGCSNSIGIYLTHWIDLENCLICFVLVNHDDCRIKFQNGIRDAKTRRVQIEDFL